MTENGSNGDAASLVCRKKVRENKLIDVNLEALEETFTGNCIRDETPFEDALEELVPQNDLRLKVLSKYRQCIAQQLNFREVILDNPRGKDIIAALDGDNLAVKQRWELTRILVSHLMKVHGDRPTKAEKIAFAKALIGEFPSLKSPEGEGYEAWYSPYKRGRGKKMATGYLEERLRNRRRRHGTTVRRSPQLKEPATELHIPPGGC